LVPRTPRPRVHGAEQYVANMLQYVEKLKEKLTLKEKLNVHNENMAVSAF
jgi:hypothetical protein